MVEAEKNQVEMELSDLQHKYSALKQQHDRTIVNNERKMPIQEHMDTIAEYKRSMDELRRTHEDELENLRSKLTSVQSEKKNVAMKLAEMHAGKSQMEGEIKALNKAQKKLTHKLGFLERELQHAELREADSNKHLNKVLAIAEQTAAERDSYEKMAKAQAQEKKKAMNKMLDSNITIGRMEEKLKMYKLQAKEKMGQLSMEMENQEGSHSSRLRQYDREVKHLQQLLRDKQDVLDSLSSDKKKVEDQLETVWQTATADNKRMKAKLAHSMKGSMKNTFDGPPFGSDSDNVGLLSSESD
ncbi:centrosomal protein of 89 kDa-like [Amphiura filiformis]|uniref:centrosomal protein of 89 kDa-like n=1 Tax=Amphiura filiformis TaxID=82378 RepID=UPI003B2178F6